MTATNPPEPPRRTRALVVHPRRKGDRDARRDPASALAECVGLTEALDLEVVGAEVAPIDRLRAGTLLGDGKIAEIRGRVADSGAELVIVDATVSPIQQRNLEKAWSAKVLDRTGLILEIFGERASTREGVLQVDLAHLTYQKGRLVRSWTHLERQRGGAGFMGGPGETQIETDRRAIDDKIVKIKKQLEGVVQTRTLHREGRRKGVEPTVALVGYTNAGKSTLFNRLTDSDVLAKDMLFATLDPTMRRMQLPGGRRIVLSDTVGFISDLPTQLVAAFRATLEEVLEADVIVHVRDMAHPETEAQKADVLDVLVELGLSEDRIDAMIEARNKIDLLAGDAADRLRAEAARGAAVAIPARGAAVAISARDGDGLPALLAAIDGACAEHRGPVTARMAPSNGRAAAWLHARGVVAARRETDAFIEMDVILSQREMAQFARTFPEVALDPAPIGHLT